LKESLEWYENNQSSAELVEVEKIQSELEEKCKSIMSNLYTKKNYDNEEEDSENTHDEL
jgi:hypothetical protein